MTILQAILLGIVQGITEFLPVSSSGHLKLFQFLFEIPDPKDLLAFDLVCHLGTLLAIAAVFRKEIHTALTKRPDVAGQLIFGTLPLFFVPIGIHKIKAAYADPRFLSLFFAISALLLFCAVRFGASRTKDALMGSRYRDALIIGLFQAAAVFPGISRSGATIASARLLGWSWKSSIRFSFLLAIPAILGGAAFEVLQIRADSTPLPSIGAAHYILGFIFSFAVGYASLLFLISLATKQKFMYFVWYCLVLSIGTFFYFHST